MVIHKNEYWNWTNSAVSPKRPHISPFFISQPFSMFLPKPSFPITFVGRNGKSGKETATKEEQMRSAFTQFGWCQIQCSLLYDSQHQKTCLKLSILPDMHHLVCVQSQSFHLSWLHAGNEIGSCDKTSSKASKLLLVEKEWVTNQLTSLKCRAISVGKN